jgi:hypothetical protein
MSTTTSDVRIAPTGEPRPIIPPLASFYVHARELSWLIVRLTAGGPADAKSDALAALILEVEAVPLQVEQQLLP